MGVTCKTISGGTETKTERTVFGSLSVSIFQYYTLFF